MRFDPNAAWTPATAAAYTVEFEKIGLEYYEDPTPAQAGMAQLRSRTRLPLATNMIVVDFDELPGAISQGSVDVVLSDPWYWGGPSRTQLLADICHVFGLGMGMHSGIELGIGMAVMAHTGVTLPNLTLAVDAHYHHLVDDVITGPRLLPDGDGKVRPPEGVGWGVELDRGKVETYRELHRSGRFANVYVEGTSGHGPDPWRPDWRPAMPSW
ncbi:enolase C-terminal domain-like protein [Kribbella sp. NPDC050124]|uniref:enolase C-terminal domain-like protein n=1 Tax=Kribbella sp. NPDC050124 TaxID=3364114 RepID=UPI003796C07D